MTGAPLPEDPRDALIREQAERLAAQDRQLAQAAVQAEQIAVLEAMVADLLERLDTALRALSRNSGNSSMPPSSDDQPGSPGASMTWEVPDRTEDHFPEGACACGRDLADAADLGVSRSFQQEEVPAAMAETVQHDLHEVRCSCGREHAAPRPAGVPGSALPVGPRLRALTVYLVVSSTRRWNGAGC